MKILNYFRKKNFYTVEFPLQSNDLSVRDLIYDFLAKIYIDHDDAETKDMEDLYLESYNEPKYISIIVQIKYFNNTYFTIGQRYPMNILDSVDIGNYIQFLIGKITLLNEKYFVAEFESVLISYKILNLDEYKQLVRVVKGIDDLRYESHLEDEVPANLPLNVDYYNWGSTKYTPEGKLMLSELTGSLINTEILVTTYNKLSSSLDVVLKNTNQIICRVTDKLTNVASNEFVRRINYKNYYIKNSKVYFIYEQLFAHKHITKLSLSKTGPKKCMTLDIETSQEYQSEEEYF